MTTMRPVIIHLLSTLLWTLFYTKAVAIVIQRRNTKDLFDNSWYAKWGDWKCSEEQLQVIALAIRQAQELAQNAIDALKVQGAETSDAFSFYFGESNATPEMVDTLITQHYQTAFSHLPIPDIPVAYYHETRNLLPWVKKAPDYLPPTKDSLVYACPPASSRPDWEEGCPNGNTAAAVLDSEDEPTYLYLCPIFFKQKGISNDITIKEYQRTRRAAQWSPGYVLVHEIQHMHKATSPSPPAIDVVEVSPVWGTNKCYSMACCHRIPDSDKIRNAENYALFALHVSALPWSAKPKLVN
ncbi:hypothetical protein LY78DRAFT_643967 [Colletotrichum sublineola]|nr:hypothetical protein LY78DRAFT_643967 [Colletotrichum sublineola]